jgi:hypothetical protein
MVGNVLVAAVGIFVIGIVTGIVILVSIGIRREERQFQEERRFLQENGIWGSPNAPDHYLLEQAPDGISSVSRALNGLHVRHLPARARRDMRQGIVG